MNTAGTTLFSAMNADEKLKNSNDSQADKDTYDRNIQTATAAKTAPKIVFSIRALSGVVKYLMIVRPTTAQSENAIRLFRVKTAAIRNMVVGHPLCDWSRNCVYMSAMTT